jgi:hypothetical protein
MSPRTESVATTQRTCVVPYPADLSADPELGPLAILDMALSVARTSVLIHNPELQMLPDDPCDSHWPPTTLVADLLVAQMDVLGDLLGHYRKAVDELRRESEEHDEHLPF